MRTQEHVTPRKFRYTSYIDDKINGANTVLHKYIPKIHNIHVVIKVLELEMESKISHNLYDT
jgi:hypothetical protein